MRAIALCPILLGAIAMSGCSAAPRPRRNDWYRDALVVLHIDNHSGLVGKGHSVEELAEMVRDIPVSMIQVSAFGAVGTTTYPTTIRPHPDLGDWDTLAAWKEVARRLDRRFCVYINTRGLRIPKDHPEWMQRDAEGKGKGRHGGLDICVRPSADGSGALETIFLPMLREIVTRYRPDGIWVDGDHARTATCYCPNCKAAWKALTGKDEPPTNAGDPNWPRWLELEQQRFDDYRRQMAEVIHACHDGCMYTSNHSWRFRSKDPRSAPDFVDTLSGDLSHGPALRLTRLSAMQVSAEERLPCDIMHNVLRIQRKPISPRRILQQGALALASGAVWSLWTPGSTIVQEASQERAKLCAEFAQARAPALGRTTSANQTAVLLSETCWHRDKIAGKTGFYDTASPEAAVLALQDAGFCVDIVNEATLRQRIRRYRTVIVANQRSASSETVKALVRFVNNDGGLLLVTGDGLAGVAPSEADAVHGMLGAGREGTHEGLQRVELGDAVTAVRSAPRLRLNGADVLATFAGGGPLLTRHEWVGKGAVACLAIPSVPYPDDGVLAAVMRLLGCGPAVQVKGKARGRHLVFSLRRKPGHVILHVTDLTSHVKGRRIEPTAENGIDDEPPLPEVRLGLPLAARPARVRVVPATTSVAHEWQDGVLHLTLRGLDVHAAVILDAQPDQPMAYLSAETPMAEPRVVEETIEMGFESLEPGRPVPTGLAVTRAEGRTSVRVTKETAASGRHSLKFTDGPGAPHPFHPYFFLRPRRLHSGVGLLSFDLKLERDAEVHVELREVENAREFPVGPSLRFLGDGAVKAAGKAKPVAIVPASQWVHAEIRFPLEGSGEYTLTLRAPGRAPQVVERLPYRSRDFWRCGWVGICGVGTAKAAFYLDNLRLTRQPAGKD